ncbi:MAG: hypothetical protein A3H49_03400 [Nitrospirae bacterium RIFCSPLOWO2_02_FULL_62_14]|nr:MAG: hypothetical protein A3H49_03400 [Nitrospirae bacterium RIFCSPLOWO2_02_FULL_62_14]
MFEGCQKIHAQSGSTDLERRRGRFEVERGDGQESHLQSVQRLGNIGMQVGYCNVEAELPRDIDVL